MMTEIQTDQQTYQRIEHAIHWLAEHYQDQPSLANAATEVGLSEYHFQRKRGLMLRLYRLHRALDLQFEILVE